MMDIENKSNAVYTGRNEAEANSLRAYLSSFGIAVETRYKPPGRLSGLTSGPLSEIGLFVPENEAAKARRLIDFFTTPVRKHRVTGGLKLPWRVVLAALLVVLLGTFFAITLIHLK
jgi:hypothetical protein